MSVLSGATLRRVIPAGAVTAVLVVSYFAPATSLAAEVDVGYGYRNNCGVKGDGFHDHGKPCPNRPFPGHGVGVLRILASEGVTPAGGTSAPSGSGGTTSGGTTSGGTTSAGHGHANGHHK